MYVCMKKVTEATIFLQLSLNIMASLPELSSSAKVLHCQVSLLLFDATCKRGQTEPNRDSVHILIKLEEMLDDQVKI